MSSDDAIQVRQSAQSASRYESTLCGRDVAFIFLSSAKGRMDFTAEYESKPLGKFNVLSQHSLARLAKALDLDDSEKDDFIAQALSVGIKLRDGDYIPAPIPDRIEIEVSEYEGRTSSFGVIEADTIGEFLSATCSTESTTFSITVEIHHSLVMTQISC